MAKIPAIRVQQWLAEWDKVPTNEAEFQSPPPREFFVTAMKASDLRRLADVHQRTAETGVARALDPYVQRSLQPERTAEIERYVQVGYPLSSLGPKRLSAEEKDSLRKPGWLPTAIIANVVRPGESRRGIALGPGDGMSVASNSEQSMDASVVYPSSWHDNGWEPTGAAPLEIIDGQHRLSSFTENDEDFELPVVLFSGLDFSWQAYIFWTVNIKPKRINASLAFDLYPLLRDQKWLEAGESLNVYRETRAQELAESLWADPRSVWHDRINMLGDQGMRARRPVTQAAFVRSLTSTFVRPFIGYRNLGGLFGGASDNSGFGWPRAQQSAFLIYAWNCLTNSISDSPQLEWAKIVRNGGEGIEAIFEFEEPKFDPAVVGEWTLLASDQGVRGFHSVVNDVCYVAAASMEFDSWRVQDDISATPESQFEQAFGTIKDHEVGRLLKHLGEELSSFDWRNSRAPGLTREQLRDRQGLRGSGGYTVLRDRLLEHLAKQDSPAGNYARVVEGRYGA